MNDLKKSMENNYLLTAVLSLIPDVFLSWIIGQIISVSLWRVWIGLQAIKIVLWIVRSLLDGALFHLMWKSGMTELALDALVEYKYPDPSKYYGGHLDNPYLLDLPCFFHDVMMDAELDIKTRLDAAQGYASFLHLGMIHGIWGARRIEKLYRKAISQYYRVRFSGKTYAECAQTESEKA